MVRNAWTKACGALVSLATVLALTGCTIPIINVEVPFDLPFELPFEMPDLSGIKLPSFDLSKLPVPEFILPIGVTTSVDEARASVLGDKASSLDGSALVQPGYLTVGVKTITSSAPMCVEGDAGSLYGIDVDLAAALASELGLKVRYVSVVDESTLGVDCDIVMNCQSDDPNTVAIAGTYVESATSFFYRGENTVVVTTDLGGKSVGVQAGSLSETVLNRTGLKMSQQPFANLNEAFDALDHGEVDFVLCEAYPGAYLASLHQGIGFAGALEVPETSGVAVQASNTVLMDALTQAFATISGNGVLDMVRARWVGAMPVLTTDSQIQNVPAAAGKSKTEPKAEDTDGESTEEGSEEEGDTDGEGETEDGSDAGSNAITQV